MQLIVFRSEDFSLHLLVTGDASLLLLLSEYVVVRFNFTAGSNLYCIIFILI
jgi:hypothetical protein